MRSSAAQFLQDRFAYTNEQNDLHILNVTKTIKNYQVCFSGSLALGVLPDASWFLLTFYMVYNKIWDKTFL